MSLSNGCAQSTHSLQSGRAAYNRARYYEPAIDRFISEDPIGFAGGVNEYAYALDDPIGFLDPSGLKPKDPWPPCGGLGVDCQPPSNKRNCAGSNAPNYPNGGLGMNELAPAMEAQEGLEYVVTNDYLIPASLIGAGAAHAIAGGALIGAGLASGPVGWFVLVPAGGALFTVGTAMGVEGVEYGLHHDFINPADPFGPPLPGGPALPPSDRSRCGE